MDSRDIANGIGGMMVKTMLVVAVIAALIGWWIYMLSRRGAAPAGSTAA